MRVLPLRLPAVVLLLACLLIPAFPAWAVDPLPPRLHQNRNISLETLDLFGVFFHRQAKFPEIRRFTDVATVKLVRNLEKTEQEASDFNTFVLDNTQGVVLFTVGLTQMGASALPQFKGAKQIVVLPNGQIAVLTSDSGVDLCASFTGDAIRNQSGCRPLSVSAKRLSAAGIDEVVILTSSGTLLAIDTLTQEQEELEVELPAIDDVHVAGEHFAFISDGGHTVTTLRNVGGNCSKPWEAWRSCQRSRSGPAAACNELRQQFQACKKENPGNHTVRFKLVKGSSRSGFPITYMDGTATGPLVLSSIVRNGDGRYYALANNDVMFVLGPELEDYGVVAGFPPWPRPFRRVFMARGVRMAAGSGLVHVFSEEAIEILSEKQPEPADFARVTPKELIPIYKAVENIPIASFLANPAQDIMARPEIREKIVLAVKNLKLK